MVCSPADVLSAAASSNCSGDVASNVVGAEFEVFAWMKHAFAVDTPGPITPNDHQREIIDRLLRAVIQRGLFSPAVMALESGRNLNFLASQVMVFFEPLVRVLLRTDEYREFARFLERRGSIDYLVDRLDALVDASSGETDAGETADHDRTDERGSA